MKYTLKKDLPFVKKGLVITEVKINYMNPIGYTYGNDGSLIFWLRDELDLEVLTNEGWIQPVIPREWIIEITKEQQYIRPYETIIEAKRNRLFSSGSEIIKVREILD